jgi:hypothetical protein
MANNLGTHVSDYVVGGSYDTWGTYFLEDLAILNQFGGDVLTLTETSGPVTLTTVQCQNFSLKMTGTGSTTVDYRVPDSISRFWYVNNARSTGSITVRCAAGGTSVTLLAGEKRLVHSDGTNCSDLTILTLAISSVTGLQAALDAKQALDTDLTAIAALTSAANKIPYATGAGTWALADFPAAARTAFTAGFSTDVLALLDDANAAAMRTSLGLAIGTNVQAYDADLASWAAVTRASGFDTWVATPSSVNLKSLITDETGSGALVFATSPTLVTPILGTPASGTLTNTTGFPVANLAGAGAGVLTFLATPSSANLAAALTDETGSGAAVFATSPTLTTPNIGAATATSVELGTFSATGASVGKQITSTDIDISKDSTGGRNHLRFYNPNGQVGGIVTNGSATAYNTSSDARLKENFRDFDSGVIIDQIGIYHFDWVTDRTRGFGVKAQDLVDVFPEAVSAGTDDIQPGDEGFQPYGVDYSKLVPLLVREVQQLRARVAVLEGGQQ